MRTMRTWLKRIYWTDEREDAAFWRRLAIITDPPGRKSKQWKGREQPDAGEVRPTFAPHYEVGDRLLVCIASSPGCPPDLVRRCPAILEVTNEPCWDPELVDRTGPRLKEGDKWGMVTGVSCLYAVDPQSAPRVGRIGLERLNRAPHSELDDAFGQEAQRLLEQIEQRSTKNGGPGSGSRPSGRVTVIPVEQGEVEGYDVESKDEVKRAHRQERQLVASYVQYMSAQGDTMVRQKIGVLGARGPIFSDLFNETRRQLIEAKAHVSRSNVRMAIGQLADYGRFIEPPVRHAVLLDSRPPNDLSDLLSRQGIAVIWPDGQRFTDDAGGEFT
jgi:hypothetical protein